MLPKRKMYREGENFLKLINVIRAKVSLKKSWFNQFLKRSLNEKRMEKLGCGGLNKKQKKLIIFSVFFFSE